MDAYDVIKNYISFINAFMTSKGYESDGEEHYGENYNYYFKRDNFPIGIDVHFRAISDAETGLESISFYFRSTSGYSPFMDDVFDNSAGTEDIEIFNKRSATLARRGVIKDLESKLDKIFNNYITVERTEIVPAVVEKELDLLKKSPDVFRNQFLDYSDLLKSLFMYGGQLNVLVDLLIEQELFEILGENILDVFVF